MQPQQVFKQAAYRLICWSWQKHHTRHTLHPKAGLPQQRKPAWPDRVQAHHAGQAGLLRQALRS
jgi:hypothetical protein